MIFQAENVGSGFGSEPGRRESEGLVPMVLEYQASEEDGVGGRRVCRGDGGLVGEGDATVEWVGAAVWKDDQVVAWERCVTWVRASVKCGAEVETQMILIYRLRMQVVM